MDIFKITTFILTLSTLLLSSCGAPGESGLFSSPLGTTTTALTIVEVNGAFEYSNGTRARSCLAYFESNAYDDQGDGRYWISPNGSVIEAQCDMTTNGGGWTLITNRSGGTLNAESCGNNLTEFFEQTCGDINSTSFNDSYNIGDTNVRSGIASNGDWKFIQYNSTGIEDSDDAYIIHTSNTNDILFPSTGVANKTPVTSVCDINDSNCDTTDVHFMWVGNGWWSSTFCDAGFASGAFSGNYGYCEDGITTRYRSNGLFGNRDQYNETKLWGHSNGARNFQERIWIR